MGPPRPPTERTRAASDAPRAVVECRPMSWVPKVEQKRHFCHKCKNELFFEVKLQRADTCPHCSVDLHCCKNCEHWDPSAHNQCKEHIAEYIPDREKANYCTFFTFKDGTPEDPSAPGSRRPESKLDALFKKKQARARSRLILEPTASEAPMSKVRYLVTGGAGFIGSNLVLALTAAGERVRVLDNLETGRWEHLDVDPAQSLIERVEGDIRDADAVARASAGVELIYHQAALGSVPRSEDTPVESDAVNVGGTVTVLDVARRLGVLRVVFAAWSAGLCEWPELPKREDMRPMPMSPYAVSKLACEHYLKVFAQIYGLETVNLRYFNVFGPNQTPDGAYAAAIPRFIDAALAGRPIQIYGDGGQTRDFCFIDNTVRANLLAAASPRRLAGEVVNIAGGRRIGLKQVSAASSAGSSRASPGGAHGAAAGRHPPLARRHRQGARAHRLRAARALGGRARPHRRLPAGAPLRGAERRPHPHDHGHVGGRGHVGGPASPPKPQDSGGAASCPRAPCAA